MPIYFNEGSYVPSSTYYVDEGVVDNIKTNIANTKDLKAQWKKVADGFVKHIWIKRYINEKQKEQLMKHYANLTDDKVYYSKYKTSFKAIAKFMGLPADKIIIENLVFTKDPKDKDQEIVSLKYSKGSAKVTIPEGIRLIHVSPVDDIKELVPSFRSKVKGKYMYPTRRCFFTVAKDIKPTQAGLEHMKLTRYTPVKDIRVAYIDPTYADYGSGSVYVETESPIPVVKFVKKLFSLFRDNRNPNSNSSLTVDGKVGE